MWSPDDEHSIPTAQDRIRATESLNLLQLEIAQTLGRADELELKLEKARAEVEELRHQAAVRTAWLAPIRRLPDEVLSLIFIQICRQEWKSPLQLGAVCRRWRHVLIATPRAWACICHDNDFNPELLDLWLSRCSAVGVHVSVSPEARPSSVKQVCTHKANIQCLSFFNNLDVLYGTFPYLEQLRLGRADLYRERGLHLNRQIEIAISDARVEFKYGTVCILETERFPKLTSLHLHSPSNSVMQAISQMNGFPSLQELHIHVCSAQWLEIIRNCAESLVTLVVEYPVEHWSSLPDEQPNKDIDLPRLQHLHYLFKDNEKLIIAPLLHTPRLQSYHEYSQYNFGILSPIHKDLGSVTSLHFERPCSITLDEFPNLTTFELVTTDTGMIDILSNLATDAILCPKLNSVKCVSASWGDDVERKAAEYLDDRRRLLGQSIEFEYKHSTVSERSGYAACYTYCSCDLSQNTTRFDCHNEETHIGEGSEESNDDEWYDNHMDGYNDAYDNDGMPSELEDYFSVCGS